VRRKTVEDGGGRRRTAEDGGGQGNRLPSREVLCVVERYGSTSIPSADTASNCPESLYDLKRNI